MKKGLSLSPKKHQIQGAKFAVKNKYSILAMDMGTGKTYTSLRAWTKSGGGNLLIVCPSSLVLNWRDEITKWFGNKYVVSVFQQGKVIYKLWDTDICITTFDLGMKASSLFEDWCDSLIIDEGHELKSLTAKRTEFYHKEIYTNSIPRLTVLTGTPIQNRVEEFYSLMAMCYYNPDLERSDFLERFPDSITFADYFSWRQEYTIEVNGKFHKVIKWEGHRRVKELKKYLKPIYFRVEFDDVVDMEPLVVKDILMSDAKDPELIKEYKRLSKLYVEDDSYDKVNSTRKAKAALEKVPFTVDYAKRIKGETGRVIIFSDHVEAAEKIAEAFGVPALTGEMSGKHRFAWGKKFQDGKVDVLVATMGAMSVGHNLTRGKDIVLNDQPWVPGKLDQVIARIRRIGQTERCRLHRIFGSPQDKKISERLEQKRKTIRAVT